MHLGCSVSQSAASELDEREVLCRLLNFLLGPSSGPNSVTALTVVQRLNDDQSIPYFLRPIAAIVAEALRVSNAYFRDS